MLVAGLLTQYGFHIVTFSLVAEMIAPLIWGAIWDTSSQGMIFIPNAVALKFTGMWKIN